MVTLQADPHGWLLTTLPSGYNHSVLWRHPPPPPPPSPADGGHTTFYYGGMYGIVPSDCSWVIQNFVMLPDHVEVGTVGDWKSVFRSDRTDCSKSLSLGVLGVCTPGCVGGCVPQGVLGGVYPRVCWGVCTPWCVGGCVPLGVLWVCPPLCVMGCIAYLQMACNEQSLYDLMVPFAAMPVCVHLPSICMLHANGMYQIPFTFINKTAAT